MNLKDTFLLLGFIFLKKTFGLHLVLVIKSENMKWKMGGKWGKKATFCLSVHLPPFLTQKTKIIYPPALIRSLSLSFRILYNNPSPPRPSLALPKSNTHDKRPQKSLPFSHELWTMNDSTLSLKPVFLFLFIPIFLRSKCNLSCDSC